VCNFSKNAEALFLIYLVIKETEVNQKEKRNAYQAKTSELGFKRNA
jgi:hypothetical protein